MLIERKDCPMRHKNGNCTVAGGFCTAVNDLICEALHNAYYCGEQSKIEWAKAALMKRSEPLSLEELRQMHGEPVWIEQENAWGIVNVDIYGDFANEPFVTFYYQSVRCDWNIVRRGLTCYRHKPVKHGRWIFDAFTAKYGNPYICTCCNTEYNDAYNYCPNCGAKMD